MVDIINFNKIPPSPSSTRKVKQTDPRGRNKQQTPFKKSLERKRNKKKKDIPGHDREPESDILLNAKTLRRHAAGKRADRCSQSSESARSRLIDIRV